MKVGWWLGFSACGAVYVDVGGGDCDGGDIGSDLVKKGAIYRDGPGRLGGSRGISGRGGHEQDGGEVGRWGRKVFCKSLQAKVGCGQGAPAGGQILKEGGEVLCRRPGE